MKIHITNLYGMSPQSVALMSQNMVAEIGRQLGMKEIGIYSYAAANEPENEMLSRFDGMNAALGNGDMVIFQLPTWNGLRFEATYLKRLRIYFGVKIVLFIHDVPPLMFASNYYLMEEQIAIYNQADLIILPSQAMHDQLVHLGLQVKKVLIQEIWDCPTNARLARPKFQKCVNFTGLPSRFPFVNAWDQQTLLNVFATEAPLTPASHVLFKGWAYGDELLRQLSDLGGFGLVWQQGDTEEYYELNVSYKLSTYLAAGLPVIVTSKASNAALIRREGLGLVIDDLSMIDGILDNLSEEDYLNMVDRVWQYRELLTGGYVTKKLLVDAIHELMTR